MCDLISYIIFTRKLSFKWNILWLLSLPYIKIFTYDFITSTYFLTSKRDTSQIFDRAWNI